MKQRKGLVVVYTGDGKGKTTAALGLALRAAGSDMRVSIIQFVKQRETGEHRAIARMGDGVGAGVGAGIEILRLGTGFVVDSPPPRQAVEAARSGLELARDRLTGGRTEMVVLDEIFPAMKARLLGEKEIHELLDLRPEGVHLVLTGRDAPQSVIERADLATEMRCLKHPCEQGLEALPGIDL
ncbi:MAG: cob(I)yrinic acid a,c-diamide adenosyltransferase [Anaerolineaceae bacterium]|nr:cob(I)yrinic acid a,c-diamide adenosyltransferase [Anaerolineaceae bacterium]